MVIEDNYLSDEQITHFLQFGYVLVPQAFSHENSDRFAGNAVWIGLGYDENDKTTWTRERIHMPSHQREAVATFAPKAWGAMCELLGGEDRIDPGGATWGDNFIVNLGTPELEKVDPSTPLDPSSLDNWHVDGDFFTHYLDSPEQALLVIPVFADIGPRGGGTYISPDSLVICAKYVSTHPEGVLPIKHSLKPQVGSPNFDFLEEIKKCKHFVELTAKKGDVILMHPLMMHSASRNFTRIPRILTNPPVSLRSPFVSSRSNPGDYSIVERTTLRALGVDRLDFQITTERKRFVGASQAWCDHRKAEEAERMRIAREQQGSK